VRELESCDMIMRWRWTHIYHITDKYSCLDRIITICFNLQENLTKTFIKTSMWYFYHSSMQVQYKLHNLSSSSTMPAIWAYG